MIALKERLRQRRTQAGPIFFCSSRCRQSSSQSRAAYGDPQSGRMASLSPPSPDPLFTRPEPVGKDAAMGPFRKHPSIRSCGDDSGPQTKPSAHGGHDNSRMIAEYLQALPVVLAATGPILAASRQ